MSISNLNTKYTYLCNGVNRIWHYDFPLCALGDLEVYQTSPSGVQTRVDGSFTVDTDLQAVIYPAPESELKPLPAGYKITLLRRTPLVQPLTLQTNGELDAKVLENGYDRATMQLQEAREQLDRAVCFPSSTDMLQTDAGAFLRDIQQSKSAAISEVNRLKDETLAGVTSVTQEALEAAVSANETAQASLGLSEESAAVAQQLLTNAQGAVVTLESYVSQSLSAKDSALASQLAAQNAQSAAQAANTQVQTAKNETLQANTAAQAAKVSAVNSSIAAGVSETNAASSAEIAQTKAQEAAQSAATIDTSGFVQKTGSTMTGLLVVQDAGVNINMSIGNTSYSIGNDGSGILDILNTETLQGIGINKTNIYRRNGMMRYGILDDSPVSRSAMGGWMTPDYTRGVTLAWGTEFTAPKAGVVDLTVRSNAGVASYYQINGTEKRVLNFGGNNQNNMARMIMLGAGDRLHLSDGTISNNETMGIFYPFKGEI